MSRITFFRPSRAPRFQPGWFLIVTALAFLASLGATPAATALQQHGTAEASAAPAPFAVTNGQSQSAGPRLVKFAGAVQDASGKAVTGTQTLTFTFYETQTGATALWSESQNVPLDDQGAYTVLLGATMPEGLPVDLFTSGQARWLGVQPQLPGVPELARVLLVGVPYALKAADADTLGGRPASAYVTTDSQTAAASAGTAPTNQTSSTVVNPAALGAGQAPPAVGGSGTKNFIPIWTSNTALGDSILFQTGGNVGIGNTTPASKLDVSGGALVRGTLELPASGVATAGTGFNSQPTDWLASSFNSSTHAAVNQHFRWQAEPVSNNTATPSGKLNLLFASGVSLPAETGLSISANGKLTFSPGQVFPGTGTISGVIAGTDLTGGGSTGSVTLNLDTTKVPLLNSANNFSGNQTITGNVTASGSISAGTLIGNGASVTNVNAALLNGIPSSSFALVNAINTFFGGQMFNGFAKETIIGDPGCGPGFAGIGFGALSGCSNYSMAGDGANTYINRPLNGTLYFREGNGTQMSIAPSGPVTITTAVAAPFFNAALTLTAGSEGEDGMQANGGGGGSEFGNGGRGLLVFGGTETNTNSQFGGDGIDVYAGTAFQGGAGIFVQGGTSNVVGGADGIDAYPGTGQGANGQAGFFFGDTSVSGNLGVGGAIFAGTKDFRIDHPMDPANKYMYHASVESSEMMDIYTGNITLDAEGVATVQLPDWFEVLNTDFRYQLTAVGAAAPNLHIAQEVANHQFGIAGGAAGMKVSWQVTGVRQDAFAKAHPLVVEEDKPAAERGFYLHPELYGQPAERQTEWGRSPQKMRHLKELHDKAPKAVSTKN